MSTDWNARYAAEIAHFVAASHLAADYHRLVKCSSGNLSCRLNDAHFLVTATRSWMADLRPDQVAVCRLDNGDSLNGVKPTVEIAFHRGILVHRQDRDAVLHFQSPAATVLACRNDLAEIDLNVTLEIPYYVGPAAIVAPYQSGTLELASEVIKALIDHDLVFLRNHGLVTCGKTLADAIQKAVFFEQACDIILRAGDRLRPLSQDLVATMRQAAIDGGAV